MNTQICPCVYTHYVDFTDDTEWESGEYEGETIPVSEVLEMLCKAFLHDRAKNKLGRLCCNL